MQRPVGCRPFSNTRCGFVLLPFVEIVNSDGGKVGRPRPYRSIFRRCIAYANPS
jgi:hypothetical protein